MWAPKVAEETWGAKPVNDMLVTYGDPLFVSPLGAILWSLGPSPKQIDKIHRNGSCSTRAVTNSALLFACVVLACGSGKLSM